MTRDELNARIEEIESHFYPGLAHLRAALAGTAEPETARRLRESLAAFERSETPYDALMTLVRDK